ncbi:MAG: protein kinase [Sporolactobacillus sp.]|jgi:serine/threonine-protein kinase|nr:protein kinase [Sporolactobacillus sp.]
MRQDNPFPGPGAVLTGKWHGRRYRIIRELGSGAQGTVFLAASSRGPVALKMAKDQASLITEVNALKELEKSCGESPGPRLYDHDDWFDGRNTIGFCAMEYLRGTPLNEALRTKSVDWAAVFVLQLLKQLQQVHRAGYVFGDLKPENLVLIDRQHRIRCVDFGGVTRVGRSIREYTECYDRGYWGLGTRKADPPYDLFACAMILLNASERRQIRRSEHPREQLLRRIDDSVALAPYRKVVRRAAVGGYSSALQMREELLKSMMKKRPSPENGRGRWAWSVAIVIIGLYVVFVFVAVI